MQAAATIIERFVTLIVDPIILVIFAAGFFMFMYGFVKFLWGSAGGEIDDNGKRHMLWGVIGMFVMVCTWGILNIMLSTFGINTKSATDVSSFKGSNIQFTK
jgi:hypothetical protein